MFAIFAVYIKIEDSLFFILPARGLTFFLGVPTLLSWHLSFFLVCVAYFDVFAWLGLPIMAWMRDQFIGAVDWFKRDE